MTYSIPNYLFLPPTQLMVSVRNAAEAKLVVDLSIPLIDIKEPARGPLGMADPAQILAIHSILADRCCLSVALGELKDWSDRATPLAELTSVQFAKVGLLGMAADPDWSKRWRDLVERLPASTIPVAVIYADYQRCAAPHPDAIMDLAPQLKCGAMLIDTAEKSSGTLLDHLALPHVEQLIARARSEEMVVVLAGSVNRQILPEVVKLHPNFVGVRGAACGRNRQTRLSRKLTIDFKNYLESLQAGPPATEPRWDLHAIPHPQR